MMFSIENHILKGARQLPSPNCSARSGEQAIDLLVIHSISLPPGQFGTGCVDKLFCNELDPQAHPYFARVAEVKVSSHLLIDRAGEVTQYVPFHQKAWHAGDSEFAGRSNCNDFSIGIELEGTERTAFTDEQYERLAEVIEVLLDAYPDLHPERIVGHSEVAPGRKTDPGPHFNWQRLRGQLSRRPALAG
ncbi:MAG: 1,6-anhydro-N-acetylmuramyl-L-alanine amidase AmpD [Pseudohongiellaceae bacterium]